MRFQTMINGLPVDAYYPEQNLRELYVPLLEHLTELQQQLQRRILVFLAAPPGTGKSTMAAFLRHLSLSRPELCPVTAIGMDGFHRPQDYLLSHTTERDGKTIRLVEIKGAPETFDLELLKTTVARVATGETCEWPEYDRLLHNPVYRGLHVEGDIVLLEGNYLLLDEEGWRDLRQYADYTIRIDADPALLRDRLITRKAASGMEWDKAEQFIDFSDLRNVNLCLEKSGAADLELVLLPDNSYAVKD